MPIQVPSQGDYPWAADLNAALKTLDEQTVVSGSVSGDSLILTRNNGTTVTAGNVRGPVGAAGGSDSSFASFVNNASSLTGAAINTKLATKADASALTAGLATIPGQAIKGAIAVKNSHAYDVGVFNYLRDGVANSAQDTRVVWVGDSHVSGGYSPHSEQDLVKRLAFRAGAPEVKALSTVTTNPGNTGMAWWNGGIGGSNSAGYISAALQNAITLVQPRYVFHVIGSNDAAVATPLATYRSNIQSKLTAIETALPNAINVLVHVHEASYFTPTIPWASYGEEMRTLANANPTRRVYIDANEGFAQLGMRTNRSGLMNTDGSHLNAAGNRWLADIIGTLVGIPSESDYAPRTQDIGITVNTGTYNADAYISSVSNLPAANYPRLLTVEASLHLTGASAGTEVWVSKTQPDAAIRKWRSGRSGEVQMEIRTTFYIPSGKAVQFLLAMTPQGSVTINAAAEYSRATAFIQPV